MASPLTKRKIGMVTFIRESQEASGVSGDGVMDCHVVGRPDWLFAFYDGFW